MNIDIQKIIKWTSIGIVFFAFIFYSGFWIGENTETKNKNISVIDNQIKKDEVLCFYRKQEATEEEPYQVEELVELNIIDKNVFGKKRGTQIGPDMYNGFYGEFEGKIIDNNLEVLFSYEIEGSKNKELEIYELQENSLIKKRYPLIEEGGILKPILEEEVKLLIYQKEICN